MIVGRARHDIAGGSLFERVLRERDGSSTISQLRDVIPELEAEYAPDILRSPSRSNVLFPFSVVPTDDDGICDARLAPLYLNSRP